MKTVSAASVETVIGFALNFASTWAQGNDAAGLAIGLLRPVVQPDSARPSAGTPSPASSQPQRVAA